MELVITILVLIFAALFILCIFGMMKLASQSDAQMYNMVKQTKGENKKE